MAISFRTSLSFISFGFGLVQFRRSICELVYEGVLLAFGVIAAIGLVFHVGPFS